MDEYELPVVIKYLRKHTGMPIKEEFIEDWIIVGQSLSQPGQSCCWNLLESRLICFKSDSPHIESYSVFSIHQGHDSTGLTMAGAFYNMVFKCSV